MVIRRATIWGLVVFVYAPNAVRKYRIKLENHVEKKFARNAAVKWCGKAHSTTSA